jgi:hypothetical protein
MSVARTRILDLMRTQCRIFNTTFNPMCKRLGNKILRQRLRGPSLAAYYPRRVATFVDLKKVYSGLELYDDYEEDRLEHLQIAKSRGKGAPKKKKSAAGEYSRVTGQECGLTLVQKAEKHRRRSGSGGSHIKVDALHEWASTAFRMGIESFTAKLWEEQSRHNRHDYLRLSGC